MASWSKGRTGRRLVTQLPSPVKCQIIKIKALTGASASHQICEALRAKWVNLPVHLQISSTDPIPNPGPPSPIIPPPGPFSKTPASYNTPQVVNRGRVPWIV